MNANASLLSRRSYGPLTEKHLDRLAAIMAEYREDCEVTHPAYADRHIVTFLAQGAANHYVTGEGGVKDLDVWALYSRRSDARFPLTRSVARRDFGPSSLGRQFYDLSEAEDDKKRRRWERWSRYEGRRVDLLLRAAQRVGDARETILAWLKTDNESPWWLAQKHIVLLTPDFRRGEVVWVP